MKNLFRRGANLCELKNIRYGALFLLIIVNIILTATPQIMGIISKDYTVIKESHPNVVNTLNEIFKMDLDCIIEEDATLACSEDYQLEVNGYKVIFNQIDTLDEYEQSTIIFYKDNITIVDIVEDQAIIHGGLYTNLIGFDFSEIEEVEDSGDYFIAQMFYSQTPIEIVITFISQVFLYTLYSLVISILFLFANFKLEKKRINLLVSYKLINAAIFLPAFLSAIISIYLPLAAGIFYMFAVIIRVSDLYFYIINPKHDPNLI